MNEFLSIFYLFIFSTLSFLSLRNGIFFILVSLPGYLIRFSLFGIPTTLLELQIYLLFFIFLIQKKHFPFHKTAFFTFIILFILFSFLSVFVNPNYLEGLGLFKAYIVDPLMFFYLFISIIKKEDIKFLSYSFIILISYLFLIAFLQYFNVISSDTQWIHETPKRITSVFEYPNALSLLLLPLSLYLTTYYFFYKKNIFFLIGSILSFLCFLMAFGKSAIFLFLLFLFIICLVKKQISFKKSLLFTFIFLSFLLSAFYLLLVHDIVSLNSFEVRMVLWYGTAKLLFSHPFLGSGLGNFPEMYDFFKEARHTELLLYPHNIFLTMYTQFGLMGFLSFFAILFSTIYQSMKKRCYLVFFPLLSIFLYGLVDETYMKNDLSIIFWFFMALFFVIKKDPYSQV